MTGEGPQPELAAAIRAKTGAILEIWERAVRQAVPAAADLEPAQVRNNLADILGRIADAMEHPGPLEAAELMRASPEQGNDRFIQQYALPDILLEDRLLRRVMLEHLEPESGRGLTRCENVALNAALDVMLQQAVLALNERLQQRLRAAAEAEAKFLSFLSHDLRGKLNSIALLLAGLEEELSGQAALSGPLSDLAAAQRSVVETVTGMERLLQSERLRRGNLQPRITPIDMTKLTAHLAREFHIQAGHEKVRLEFDVSPDAVIDSDRELLSIMLRNLIENALKFTGDGMVRVAVERQPADAKRRWTIAVSDQGPGIEPEMVRRMFDAFQRGNARGQPGVGLGLAIISDAARLLGAELQVESVVGQGTTFRIRL
ncbi:MAG TPA: HAMP domain-containing sensor histidine kinase [Tepidisphaeraceae bacterium]|nr:HAMP domain-containing sensor histidine kinase [Tepidisphaeraceae bacterium]